MSEKFPDTPAGRQAAINATPLMGWWEERVDYSGFHLELDDQTLAAMAVAQIAQEQPSLFSEEQHRLITNIIHEMKGKLR